MAKKHKDNGKAPLIVIEGLDGSGKTTLGKTLAQKLGFEFIDSMPDVYRRTLPDFQKALSADGFYMHMWGMLRHLSEIVSKKREEGRGIILGRYYPTTSAYYVARCAVMGRLPTMPAITNPELLRLEKPSSMFFLDLPEEVRQSRLLARGNLSRDDNATLDDVFRAKLLEEYSKYTFETIHMEGRSPEDSTRYVWGKIRKDLNKK